MRVAKNENNHPLTPTEMVVCRQFEQSDQEGQALFHPQVADSQPAPDCVAFFKEVGRFGITILEGQYSVEGGQWFRHDEGSGRTPIDNPLEGAWQAAKAVRTALKEELEIGAYVIPVVWFSGMEEDEDVLDEASGRSVRVLFAQDEMVQRLVNIPKGVELQGHLSSLYIKREVAVLSPAAVLVGPAPAGESQPDEGRPGAITFQRVETVNIYVTVVNGGIGDAPPLITVPGQ